MFRFPFSNYQELNLDWILAKVKEFAELVPGMREVLDKSEKALSDATEAITTANEAKEIAEQAVQGIVGPNSVNSAAIQAGAVTREKIASGAVNSTTLSENAVYSINIADGEIVSNKIRAGAVTTAKIADGSVSTTKLGDGQVTTAKLADGAVTADKIAPGAIPQASIADGSITTAKLDSGAVTAAKLASNAVTTEKIADDAVTGDKIAEGSITNALLSSDFVFPKSMQLDLVWRNPSTASSFDTQTVTISEEHIVTKYKYLMILLYSPNNGYVLFPFIAGALCPVQIIGGLASAADPFAVYQRSVTASNTMITITTCTVKSSAGTLITDPDAMKPVSIYGLI